MIIWRFTDGKLGHENQTAGLVTALKNKRAVSVFDIQIGTLPSTPLLLLKALFRLTINQFPAEKPDLIIGAGHKTHIPMVIAKSMCGGMLVVLMRPSIPIRLFDLVVTPKQDMARIEQELEPYSAYLPLRYIDEKDLILDATIRRGVGGWRKQQLIKLAVSSIIHSAYYITFDADVLLKNTLSNEDLIIKGKALLQHQHKSVRPHWWKGSAEILKIDPEMDNLGME